MGEKLSDSALDTIFRTARTYNGYTDEPVTQDQIRQIHDLLKMGPTAANQQPARFVWLLSQAAKDKLADCATGTNPDKIRKAPAAVVIGMDAHFHEHLPFLFPHTDARSWFAGDEKTAMRHDHALRNSSLQGAYLLIAARAIRSDEHTSELQSLMRISYAVFCLKKK